MIFSMNMQSSCRLAAILCFTCIILLSYHAEANKREPPRILPSTTTAALRISGSTSTQSTVKRDGNLKKRETSSRSTMSTTTTASKISSSSSTQSTKKRDGNLKKKETFSRSPMSTTTTASQISGSTSTQSTKKRDGNLKKKETSSRSPMSTTTAASRFRRKGSSTTESAENKKSRRPPMTRTTPASQEKGTTTTKPGKRVTPKDEVPKGSEELQSTACPYQCRKSCLSQVTDAKGACKLFSSGRTLSDIFKRNLRKEGLEDLFKKVVEHKAFVIANDVISCQKMMSLLKTLKPKEKNIDLELMRLTSPKGPSTDLTKQQMLTLVTVLNKTAVEDIVDRMSEEHKKKACLNKYSCMLKRIAFSFINCDEVLNGTKLKPSDEKMWACDGVKRIKSAKGQAELKLTDDDCTKILTDYPLCLKHINIDTCKPAAFVSAATKLTEMCIGDKISKLLKVTINKKILLATDKTSAVVRTVLACGGNVERLKKEGFTWAQLVEYITVDVIKKLSAREQSKALHNAMSQLTTAQKDKSLKIIGALICATGSMKYLQELKKTQLESIICDLATSTKCPGLLRQIQNLLPSFKNFARLDKTKTKCLGCLLAGDVSTRQLQKIPKAFVTNVLDEDVFKSCPADAKLVCKNVKVIVDKIRDEKGRITMDSYKKFGDKLKECLDFSMVARFPSAILCDDIFAEDLPRIKGKPTSKQCKLIKAAVSDSCFKKFKCKFGASGMKDEAKEIAKYLKEEEVVPANKYESPFTVLKQLESELKENVPDWPSSYFVYLKNTNVLTAIRCDVIEALLAENLKDKLEVILDITPSSNERMLRCLKKLWIELQGNEPVSDDDEDALEKLAVVMDEKEAEDLKVSCAKRCELVGQDISGMSRKKVKELANKCINCLQPSGKLTEENLALLGKLVCGLEDLRRIDLSIANVGKVLSSCPYMGEQITSVQCQAKRNFLNKDTSAMTVEDIKFMSLCILFYAPPAKKDVFCEVIVGISEDKNEDLKRQRERKEKGFKDCSADDKQKHEARSNKFMDTSLTVFVQLKCLEPTAAKRRKRSGGALTCDVISIFGEAGVTSMTKDNIAALSSDDFLNCVDNFCIDHLNSEQMKALADKAKENTVWGAPSSWTEDQIDSACYFVKGLSAVELSSLNLTENMMDSFSKIKTWEENQRAAIYQKFMEEIVMSNDSSVLESGHLMTLGSAVCGADTDAIREMNTTAILNSLPALGVNIPACNTMQKITFLENVKKSLGNDISQYTVSNVELLGGIMAGVTSSTVKTLTESQIQALSGYVIASFADEVFVSMTPEQLAAFSSIQAQSVTDSQLANLPADRRKIVLEKAGLDYNINHAAMVSWSPITWLVMVVCVLLTYM